MATYMSHERIVKPWTETGRPPSMLAQGPCQKAGCMLNWSGSKAGLCSGLKIR